MKPVQGYQRPLVSGLTFFLLLLFLSGCRASPNPKEQVSSKINFSVNDRILILTPHPDDEILACGGVIQEAIKQKLPIKIAFLTYGDNNQWAFLVYRKHPVLMPKAVRGMGAIRHDEAIAAAKKIGLTPDQLVFLGYPDFRTLDIWYSHWGQRPPAESMLTHVNTVPYGNALRPGTPYKGEEILKDLKTVIREFKPTKIFLSHPLDHNPDHRSLYLFTRIALWDLREEATPELYPYLVHYVKWPQPMKYDPRIELLPPAFLTNEADWKRLDLSPAEVAKKHEALKQHRSQYQSSPKYLRLFIRANELFGDYPTVMLKEKLSLIRLADRHKGDAIEGPEQLLEEEKAKFVGVESATVDWIDHELVLTIKLSRPLGKAVGLSVYAFGYKNGKDFAQMPKIHVAFGAVEHRILDQDKVLDSKAVSITRKSKEVTVKIPFALLDNPDRILTSARTYLGNVPLDWTAWRVLELSN